MHTLHFDITIDAPVETVWETMLSDEAYRDWSGAFSPGSYFDGSWDEGSEIRFLGPDEEGSFGGLIATITENRKHDHVSMVYTGAVMDGAVDTESAIARQIIGTTETYRFYEDGARTTVTVEAPTFDDDEGDMEAGWPRALDRLKELAEQAAAARLPDGVHSGKHAR